MENIDLSDLKQLNKFHKQIYEDVQLIIITWVGKYYKETSEFTKNQKINHLNHLIQHHNNHHVNEFDCDGTLLQAYKKGNITRFIKTKEMALKNVGITDSIISDIKTELVDAISHVFFLEKLYNEKLTINSL